MSKPKAKIKNWKLAQRPKSMYLDPPYFLIGKLVEHHTLKIIDEDNEVHTSNLIKIDFENKIAETKHTIYELL